MKYLPIILGLLMVITTSIRAQDTKPVWSVDSAYPLPESVYYNPHMNELIVSHVYGGPPTAKDGDGCLSRYSLDGKLIKAQWITGLNAPKGSRAQGNHLWVSDIDRLVCVDTDKAEIIETIDIPGSKFLNDLAFGKDGTVYVSDMNANNVYKIRDGKYEVIANITRPNGVLLEKDRLLVAGRDPKQTDKGCVLAVNLKTGKVTPLFTMPTNGLDGFESDGIGGYFISDWDGGCVHHVDAKRHITTIIKPGKGSADIGFNPANNQLLVPMMVNQRIDAYDISPWVR